MNNCIVIDEDVIETLNKMPEGTRCVISENDTVCVEVVSEDADHVELAESDDPLK